MQIGNGMIASLGSSVCKVGRDIGSSRELPHEHGKKGVARSSNTLLECLCIQFILTMV